MPKRSSKKRNSKKSVVYPDATTLAGQRRQVWEGRADMTRGGLTKEDLMVSKSTGVIVSKKASKSSLRNFQRNGLAMYTYPKK